jgi:amino acid transporter
VSIEKKNYLPDVIALIVSSLIEVGIIALMINLSRMYGEYPREDINILIIVLIFLAVIIFCFILVFSQSSYYKIKGLEYNE